MISKFQSEFFEYLTEVELTEGNLKRTFMVFLPLRASSFSLTNFDFSFFAESS